jgi:hypothetical protein
VFEQGILGESLNFLRDQIQAEDPATVTRPVFPLKPDSGYEVSNTLILPASPTVFQIPAAALRRSLLRMSDSQGASRGSHLRDEMLTMSRGPFTASTFQL